MSEWIKVTEALPNHLDDVLVWEGHGLSDTPAVAFIDSSGAWRVNTEHYETDGNCSIISDLVDVTHWMPLPDPPETD